MVNCFYTLMLEIAAIVSFTLSNDDSGAIVSGIFLICAGVCYGIDTYFALVNMGALNRPAESVVAPTVNVPPSQPFTPPPVYNPPPSLAGPGPYTVPSNAQTTHPVAAGDLGSSQNPTAHY